MTLHQSQTRAANTSFEIVIAILILGLVASSLGQFVHHIRNGLDQRDVAQRIDFWLENVREELACQPPEKVSSDLVAEWPIPQDLSQRVEAPRLSASVKKIEHPLSALEITLSFHCRLSHQDVTPKTLTFWMADR
ncbi:MAG: hypothetical protein KDB03_11960 [Planctomycetales bacterium]|nr:hypothetical protein [Planctomycetales bacterium]